MKNTRQENRKIYIILAIIIAIGVLIVTGVLNVSKVNLFFHSNISNNNSVMSNTIEVIVGYVCLTIGILIFSVSMIAFSQHNQKVDGIIKECHIRKGVSKNHYQITYEYKVEEKTYQIKENTNFPAVEGEKVIIRYRTGKPEDGVFELQYSFFVPAIIILIIATVALLRGYQVL